MSKTYVIKIGGSILSLKDDTFNFEQAIKLKDFFSSVIGDNKYILITGGGFLARNYQQLLKTKNYSDYDQHYIGTVACNMNAVMLRSVFGDLAEDKILGLGDLSANTPVEVSKRFLIAGAGDPGPSSDWDATWMAKRTGANSVITLKDVDGVYSADPDKYTNAKRLDNVTWDEYIQIIGNANVHIPGGNLPVDPIAARMAKENNIKFYVVDGNDFTNLKNLLSCGEYKGTQIY